MGMTDLTAIIERVRAVERGFGPIKSEAQRLVGEETTSESLLIGKELLESEYYQVRMLAAFMLGMIADKSAEAFAILLETVSMDPDWRVQEVLAKAFDQYCTNEGYAPVLSVIEQWLGHTNPNVRRAAVEGPRIWTTRPFFRENPQRAIALLSALKSDESEYVRKSVGNALRDISRKHAELVRGELATWDLSDERTAFTYRLAARFLV
jgi:3-methyladenine DNA glycosylase AlkC